MQPASYCLSAGSAVGSKRRRHRQDVPGYGEKMADAAEQHENVPDGMAESHFLLHVEDGTYGIAEASSGEPEHAVSADGFGDLW